MGYWPDVNPGDTFQPNAKLENEVRHRLNEINGFLSGTITAGKTTSSLCIKGYNPTSDETIAAGDVVIIPEGPIVEDAFPVATMIDGEYHMLVDSWGIAQEEIGPKGIGSILIMGAAIVPIISETGTDTFDFVKPVGGGGSFKKAKSGIAKYLRPIGTNHALIFVGISSGFVYEQGKGVKITGGTYGIPPKISSEIEPGTDIGITGGSNGQPYVISYTGSGGGGGGGIGYPDYLALNKLPSGLPAPSGEGIGSTYLLPVKAGVSIKYFSPIQYCVALFAVADGWDGTPYVLTNDTAYTTPAAGWVRISILDDGDHQNGCLRFYVGTSDWTKALPLYRCGTFRAGATGISSNVSGGTATISLTGGSGSVKVKPGNNVSISGTNGVIEISATGGGGGGDDAVIIYQEEHTESGQITAQTNKKYYIALFGALYYDSESYNYVCQYYITYDHSTTPYTIVRHKTDYSDLESYWQGDGYSLELVLTTPNEDCYIDICLFAFSNILISSAKPIYNYQGAPCAQPYMLGNRNVKLVYIANDNGGRWYLYGN